MTGASRLWPCLALALAGLLALQSLRLANAQLELAKVEGDAEQLTARLQTLQAEKSRLDGRWHEVKSDRDRAQASLDQLQGHRQAPPVP